MALVARTMARLRRRAERSIVTTSPGPDNLARHAPSGKRCQLTRHRR